MDESEDRTFHLLYLALVLVYCLYEIAMRWPL